MHHKSLGHRIQCACVKEWRATVLSAPTAAAATEVSSRHVTTTEVERQKGPMATLAPPRPDGDQLSAAEESYAEGHARRATTT